MSANGFGIEAVQELKDRGFRGNFLPADIETSTVFRDWDTLVAGLTSLVLNLPRDLREYIQEVMPQD